MSCIFAIWGVFPVRLGRKHLYTTLHQQPTFKSSISSSFWKPASKTSYKHDPAVLFFAVCCVHTIFISCWNYYSYYTTYTNKHVCLKPQSSNMPNIRLWKYIIKKTTQPTVLWVPSSRWALTKTFSLNIKNYMILYLKYDKLRLGKRSFKLTNITCAIHGTITK